MAEESVAAYAAQFGDPFPLLMLWEGTDEDLVTLLQQCLKEGRALTDAEIAAGPDLIAGQG